METNIKITQVGYEVELDSQWPSENRIADELWLNFKDFLMKDKFSLMIKMSKEYYGSTIEFNFIKEKFSLNLHRKIKRFVTEVMNDYWLRVWGMAPSFVWTHIHFFRSWLENQSTDTILKIVLKFILDNIEDLHINSIERVICSHQLWGHYACNNDIISQILSEELWRRFSYPDQSRNRPKYRPVIHSPRSTTWKLRSTEIRLIPTEFILNDKVLDLFKRLESLSPMPNEDIPTLYRNLIKEYKNKQWATNQERTTESSR